MDMINLKFRLGMVAVAVIASLSLGACSSLSKLAGNTKNPPDEFKIVNKPPLVMPPDFNLRPPRPGAPEPQNLSPTAQAISALFPGRTTLPPPASAGENALLKTLGAGQANANIRSNVGDDTTLVVEKGALLRDLLTAEEREGSPDGSSVERISSEPLDSSGN